MEKVKKPAISEEMAIKEFVEFLKPYKKRDYRKGNLTTEKILDEYPNVIDSIMDGLLLLKEKSGPKLILRVPIETEGKNEALSVKEVIFKTRVKPSDVVRLMDGINPQTQTAKYVMRFLRHLTGLAQGEIDNMDQEDYETLNQLSSVFQ
nr:hypothetical protein [uncultured Allomuricauda sp.]